MRITKKSSISGIVHTREIDVTPGAFEAWQMAGPDDPKRFVQVAFPHLSDEDREFIMTGITEEEWDTMLPPDPDQEVPPPDPASYDDVDNEDWAGR